MIDTLVEYFATLIEGRGFWTPFIVLIAGVITGFSPCCLASVPLVMGYVGGVGGRSLKRSLWLSSVFSGGLVVSSTLLGLLVAVVGLGVLMIVQGTWWYLLIAVLMFLMGLQVLGVIEIIPSTYLQSRSKKQGSVGAFVAGLLAGIFSSPCSTPILVVILSWVIQEGDIVFGASMLFLYSIGHSVVFIVAGVVTGVSSKVMRSKSYRVISRLITILSALTIFGFGMYMIYLAV